MFSSITINKRKVNMVIYRNVQDVVDIVDDLISLPIIDRKLINILINKGYNPNHLINLCMKNYGIFACEELYNIVSLQDLMEHPTFIYSCPSNILEKISEIFDIKLSNNCGVCNEPIYLEKEIVIPYVNNTTDISNIVLNIESENIVVIVYDPINIDYVTLLMADEWDQELLLKHGYSSSYIMNHLTNKDNSYY